MTVVSNTSPISNLAAIGQLSLLQLLYGSITIPPAVADEIAFVGAIYTQAAAVPSLSWITIQPVIDRTLVERLRTKLDKGESEAIALAVELEAELLLIDEQLGRKLAWESGLEITGLLGVLVEAKSRGAIAAVKPLMDDLMVQARFRVSQKLYVEVLQLAGE